MRIIGFLILLVCNSPAVNASESITCSQEDQPQLFKPLEDFAIIADNIALIATGTYFTGSNLTYSISYKHTKPQNKVSINQNTGELRIDAQTRDKFDIQVTAKNSCGTAKSTFNVQIDQEE